MATDGHSPLRGQGIENRFRRDGDTDAAANIPFPIAQLTMATKALLLCHNRDHIPKDPPTPCNAQFKPGQGITLEGAKLLTFPLVGLVAWIMRPQAGDVNKEVLLLFSDGLHLLPHMEKDLSWSWQAPGPSPTPAS